MSLAGRFRYSDSGRWYKGNVHTHTNLSDGRIPFDQAVDFYAKAGYDFLSVTDHWVPCQAKRLETPPPLLLLDGIELDGQDDQGYVFHVVGLGGLDGVHREMGLFAAMESIRAQGGLLVWAHPHASGNRVFHGLAHGFDGVEVYNFSSQRSIGKGFGAYYWDAVLEKQPGLLGFASDDTHFIEGFETEAGGWIMVRAPELSAKAILEAIRQGNFYSTSGPAFDFIGLEKGNRVFFECSPVAHTRLIGPRGKSKWRPAGSIGQTTVTSGHFRIPEDFTYARLEIEDEHGRIAWSNPLLVP